MTDKEYAAFDYTGFVNNLRAYKNKWGLSGDILHSVVGISGESGELLDHIKKVIWQGHCLDVDYIKKELGDILYYFTSLCDLIDTNIDEVRKLNIEKLTKRYPDGVFDEERSIHRDDSEQ